MATKIIVLLMIALSAIIIDTICTVNAQNFSSTQVYIHPFFRQENPLENNVAIISVNGSFDARIVPRSLGSLKQNSTCELFGWGPTDFATRGDAITVSRPQECNATQAFCSSHLTIFHHSCNAMTGSPVTRGGNEQVVAGFLINNATCSSSSNRVSLSYHSVNDFYDWISGLDPDSTDPKDPTDTTDPTDPPTDGSSTTTSTVFVLLVVLISCGNMN